MVNYLNILQMGLQSLLAVFCGWGCGHFRVLDAQSTVSSTNTLVLKFCIPCLQIWLLAIKTDMRQPGNMTALGVFLLWSVSLQLLLAVQQLLTRQPLQLARLGVDSLILTTNNTGILGPVVLEAAVGRQFAPLGMLATVVLYFQQLPSAQLLFQLHRAALDEGRLARAGPGPSAHSNGGHRNESEMGLLHEEPQSNACVLVPPSVHDGDNFECQSQRQTQQQHARWQQRSDQAEPDNTQHHPGQVDQAPRPSSSNGHPAGALAAVVQLLWRNSLVWSTAVSLLLSFVGSSSVLDPEQTTALNQLAFVEGLLGWFAQATAPLTLFTTGLWMQSNSSSSSRAAGGDGVSSSIDGGLDESVSSRQLCLYLLLRASVAPAMMVLLCWLLGVAGDLAHALVILALLPVAQTAFVVCKQYDVGTHVVSIVMVASLFLMLPQLMAVLALLEGLGILEDVPG